MIGTYHMIHLKMNLKMKIKPPKKVAKRHGKLQHLGGGIKYHIYHIYRIYHIQPD